ncbi:MAG: hypothetical protein ACHQD9_00845 [Chitinophagales bacterium]
MKTKVLNAALPLLLIVLASSLLHANSLKSNRLTKYPGPGALEFSISIPQSLQSQIVRQDFENESIFNFKNEKGKPAFLFSITKVTSEQWMQIHQQVNYYKILENKDGYITFVQITDQSRIKGDNAGFQQALQQVNSMIESIQL